MRLIDNASRADCKPVRESLRIVILVFRSLPSPFFVLMVSLNKEPVLRFADWLSGCRHIFAPHRPGDSDETPAQEGAVVRAPVAVC